VLSKRELLFRKITQIAINSSFGGNGQEGIFDQALKR